MSVAKRHPVVAIELPVSVQVLDLHTKVTLVVVSDGDVKEGVLQVEFGDPVVPGGEVGDRLVRLHVELRWLLGV